MSDQELEAAMAANNTDQQLRAKLIHAEGEIIDSALDRVVTKLRRWSGVEGSNANGQPPPPPYSSPDTTDIALLVFTGENWHKAAVANPTADGSCGSGALELLKELKRDNANDVRSASDTVRLAREMAFMHWTQGGERSEDEFTDKLIDTGSHLCRSSTKVKQWITAQIFRKSDGVDHSAVSCVGCDFASAAVHCLLTELPKMLEAIGGSPEKEPIAKKDALSEAALNKLGGLLRDMQALLGDDWILFKVPTKPQEEPQGEKLWTCRTCTFAQNKLLWPCCDMCGAQRSGGHDAAQLLREMCLSRCIVKEGNHREDATHELQLTDTQFDRVSFACVTENLDVHSLQLAMILRGWLPVTVECPSVFSTSPSNRLQKMQENKAELVKQLAESTFKQVKDALCAVGARKSEQHLSMELGIMFRTNMAIISPGHYRVGVLADTFDPGLYQHHQPASPTKAATGETKKCAAADTSAAASKKQKACTKGTAADTSAAASLQPAFALQDTVWARMRNCDLFWPAVVQELSACGKKARVVWLGVDSYSAGITSMLPWNHSKAGDMMQADHKDQQPQFRAAISMAKQRMVDSTTQQ
jgi:hypothetical protein